MHKTIEVTTNRRSELIDITSRVQGVVEQAQLREGLVVVYCPHTTGAITINEGADPDVRADIVAFLDTLVPRDWGFKHREGNSDSHVKTSLIGASETVFVEGGELVLGTWQRIYFCEFDGPRRRRFFVRTI